MCPVAVFPIVFYLISVALDLLVVKNRRKIICFIFFLGYASLIGLKNIHTAGVDTYLVYQPIFEQLQDRTFEEVLSLYCFRDPLFYICTKVFTLVWPNFQAYLLFIAIFVAGSISYFTYRYSAYPILTFSLFILLQYFGFEFQMIKHSIAFSILLFSYPFLLERRLSSFLLVVFVASLFHVSALVFLVAYFVSNIKKQALHLVVLVFFALIIIFCGKEIMQVMSSVFTTDRFQMYFSDSYDGALSLTAFYIAGAVLLLGLYVAPKNCWDGKVLTVLFNLSYVSVLTLLGVTILGEAVRVSMLFGMGSILFLPLAIKKSAIKYKGRFVYFVSFICLIYFFMFGIENAGLNDYAFFWQMVN